MSAARAVIAVATPAGAIRMWRCCPGTSRTGQHRRQILFEECEWQRAGLAGHGPACRLVREQRGQFVGCPPSRPGRDEALGRDVLEEREKPAVNDLAVPG